MKTSEERAVQLSYKIVEYCEHSLSRNERENQVAKAIKEELDDYAKQKAVEFYKHEKHFPEGILYYDKYANDRFDQWIKDNQ